MTTTWRNFIATHLVGAHSRLPESLKLTPQERYILLEKLRERADQSLFPRARVPIIDTHVFQLMTMKSLTDRELAAVYWLQDCCLDKFTSKEHILRMC